MDNVASFEAILVNKVKLGKWEGLELLIGIS